ncbi:hypothetical protein D3C72_1082230 [compost metagenome]|jgi:hypothetical protein
MCMLVLDGFTTCLAQSAQAQTPMEVFAEARAVCRADRHPMGSVRYDGACHTL